MTHQRFNEDLLQAFMHGFYGYGSSAGAYWFVGMEEGGGNSFEEINRRLNIWDEMGRMELLDVAEFHLKLGMPEYFTDPVKLQSTWNKLSRIVLSSNGSEATLEAVRAYQKDHLGRIGGDTCLLELLPLPSPSTGKWLYAQHCDLPFLKSRKAYREHSIPFRIEHIRRRIKQYRPRAVVFYGMGYQQWWREIADLEYQPYDPIGFLVAKSKGTIFVISNHPVATGVYNEYFHEIGRVISTRL
jgi:hypothetical protein